MRIENLPREGKRFVSKFSSLEEHFSLSEGDGESGILELERNLLQIDPRERWTAKKAIETSRFFEELRRN